MTAEDEHPASTSQRSISPTPSFQSAEGSPMSLDIEALPRKPRYRSAKPLPDPVRNHCHVLIDEQQYGSALSLLQDLVIPGFATPGSINTPVLAPLPLHIEIANAILIHPRFTNQLVPGDHPGLAAKCITFLRNTLAILGPINSKMDEAFSFEAVATARTIRRSRNRADPEDSSSGSENGDGYDHPKVLIANGGRIRRNAKDFWHMVGWAFNCSVKHPQRWKYWKVWLAYMLDVIDADWLEREIQDQDAQEIHAETAEGPVEECQYNLCRESILVSYLSEVRGRSSGMKRVVRSVFADGSRDSLSEFPEVWANETKSLKPKTGDEVKQKLERSSGPKRKRDFGDFDEDPELASDSDKSTELCDGSDEDMGPGVEDPWLGGPESIFLRQRLLVLLSRIAAYFSDVIGDVRDVYDAIYANMKPIPVPAFTLFVSPSKSSPMPRSVFVSLTALLLLRLLPANAPQPHTITSVESDSLSQDLIEQGYLPFAANTSSVSDNAKLSILIESVFRFFLNLCPSYHNRSLDAAVEKGIKAREIKAGGDRRKKNHGVIKAEDQAAWEALKSSGERLRTLRAWVEQNSEES